MVDTGCTMLYTAFGERFSRRRVIYKMQPNAVAFGGRVWELNQPLSASRRLDTANIEANSGGLSFRGCLGAGRAREMSRAKLAYTI